MSIRSQLKINGREVPVLGNQMIFDLTDFDLAVPVEEPPKSKYVQKCECGSWAIGVQDFSPGHSEYCPVHEDKTPLMR